ncbi:hypothetical protein BV25DRAFT_1100386 [Artomyces pyxidatus]|uniref:Uncharacterized protein n=1 Tax=Artomyces pyxidatus TaxID=48021 RepID=A0ACB8TGB4_9AGAM|nr:hypothetical protein BV25DRAFT_1100386 [Artomyces pyxidatus]
MSNTAPIDLELERSLYVGNFFRGILYGLEVYTFFTSVYCLWGRPSSYTKDRRLYVGYGAVLLCLVTIAVTTDALWGQYMWIDHRNDVGGPLGYFGVSGSSWFNVFGSSADATANVLGDGLLLYRCYMIWGSRLWVIAFPALIYLASTVLVIITVVESALPNAFLLNGSAANFGVPWVACSVSLNIIVTGMICGRLLYMRHLTRTVMTPEMAYMYTSIIAILIESAMPFSIVGIGLVITYAQNNPTSTAFAYVWGMFCSLSPQMIILRVAMGRGWSRDTAAQLSHSINFATMPPQAEKSSSTEGQSGEDAFRERSTVLGSSAFAQGSNGSIKKEKNGFDSPELAISMV